MKIPLNYAKADTPRPGWEARFVRARYVFVALYVLGIVAWYVTMFSDAPNPLGFNMSWEPVPVTVFTLIMLGGQVLLLAGAPHWRWPRPRRRGAMWVSIAAGGLIAALLTVGIALSLFAELQLYDLVPNDLGTIDTAGTAWAVIAVLVGVPWLFWALLFGLFWAGEWMSKFRRIYRLLLAGTWLELAITIPVDVQVRKRASCYCGYGTFFALMIGLTAIFWTFGPGVVLLFLTRRMQRRDEIATNAPE